MQATHGIFSILGISHVYSLLQNMIGSQQRLHDFVKNYIKPTQGCHILDIGCGPADILSVILAEADVNYCGFDLSADYIKTAQQRYGCKGTFFCASVTDELKLPVDRFDVILLLGVLHHLSYSEATGILSLASKKLAAGGSLITLDPCFVPKQHKISRLLIQHDRGREVRTPDDYTSLAMPYFSVTGTHTNFNRIPYDHWLMQCTAPSN